MRGTNKPNKFQESVWKLVNEYWVTIPSAQSHYAAKKISDHVLITQSSLLPSSYFRSILKRK